MEEQERQPEEAAYHYSNGGVARCEESNCDLTHLTLDQMAELDIDVTQGSYRPRHASGVQS